MYIQDLRISASASGQGANLPPPKTIMNFLSAPPGRVGLDVRYRAAGYGAPHDPLARGIQVPLAAARTTITAPLRENRGRREVGEGGGRLGWWSSSASVRDCYLHVLFIDCVGGCRDPRLTYRTGYRTERSPPLFQKFNLRIAPFIFFILKKKICLSKMSRAMSVLRLNSRFLAKVCTNNTASCS